MVYRETGKGGVRQTLPALWREPLHTTPDFWTLKTLWLEAGQVAGRVIVATTPLCCWNLALGLEILELEMGSVFFSLPAAEVEIAWRATLRGRCHRDHNSRFQPITAGKSRQCESVTSHAQSRVKSNELMRACWSSASLPAFAWFIILFLGNGAIQ